MKVTRSNTSVMGRRFLHSRSMRPKKISAAARLAAMFAPADVGGVNVYNDWATSGSLFKDSAGTQPVTALEDLVGLDLDRRYGGALGTEQVVNGTFPTDVAGWTNAQTGGGTGSVIWNAGKMRVINDTTTGQARGSQLITGLVVNRLYTLSADVGIVAGTPTNTRMTVAGVADYDFPATQSQVFARFVATATSATVSVGPRQIGSAVPVVSDWDNISVREIPGIHWIQPLTTSRAILTALKNQIKSSEVFSNAAWAKQGGAVVVDNTDTGPGGVKMATVTGVAATTTYLQQSPITVQANSTGAVSVYVKAGTSTRSQLRVFNSAISAVVAEVIILWSAGVPSISTIGGTWAVAPALEATSQPGVYRFTGAFSTGSNTALAVLFYPAALNTSDTVKVGGFQFVSGLVSGRYQRTGLTPQTGDYDAVGFPVGLRYDGTDDGYYTTGNVDWSGTDKASLSFPVRKESDAAAGIVFETSASATSTNGAVGLYAPGSATPNVQFASRGVALQSAVIGSLAAPTTLVLTGKTDIGAPLVGLTVNPGSLTNQNTSSQGGGNLGSYKAFRGRRNDANLPFNGVMYGGPFIGRPWTAAEQAVIDTVLPQLSTETP